jgi:hypothetical protein
MTHSEIVAVLRGLGTPISNATGRGALAFQLDDTLRAYALPDHRQGEAFVKGGVEVVVELTDRPFDMTLHIGSLRRDEFVEALPEIRQIVQRFHASFT